MSTTCSALLLATILPARSLRADPPPTAPGANPAGSAQEEAVAPATKLAVERALAYLKSQQSPDGSFAGNGGVGETAVPSLVVLTFLAHGDVPGQGPYSDVMNKAIDFVLNSQQPDGTFAKQPVGNVMYEHGISTVMLSEVYGMVDDTRRARIDTALGKSVALILAAQKVPKPPQFMGGWRYTPQSSDSDISATGWQLMALRGAANCGAPVPQSALADGVDYIRRSAVAAGGGFAYQPGGAPNQARSGTGIVAMELLGKHNTPEAIAAGNWLVAHPPLLPNNTEFYFYAIYYDAQAANQLGGQYWSGLYPPLCQNLLTLQRPDGHFEGAAQDAQAGLCYTTAMSTLALCVPFRYLPLYQR